jgi:O-antigen/teichoic acid export membrane protein
MARTRRAIYTIIANVVAAGARVLASIASVPMLVAYLGAEKYGLAVTIASMAMWLSFFDGGFGISLKNELIKAYGSKELDALHEKELASTAAGCVVAIVLIAGVVLTATIMGISVSPLLNLSDSLDEGEARTFLIVAIWLFLLSLPLGISRSVYSARQEEYLVALPTLIGMCGGLGLIYAATTYKWGLVVAGNGMLIGHIIGAALTTILLQARRHLFDVSCFRRDFVHRLANVGAAFVITQIAIVAIFQANGFIANLFLGQRHAAEFYLHYQVVIYAQSASQLAILAFWAPIGEAIVRNDRSWVSRTIMSLVAVVGLTTMAFAVSLVTWGREIFDIWSRGHIPWNPELGAVLSAYLVVSAVCGVPSTALAAAGDARNQAKAAVMHAILNVALATLLVQKYGAVGIAWGALVSYVLTTGVYVVVSIRKVL